MGIEEKSAHSKKIDTSTMPYYVVLDDGRKEWCYGHDFKLLKEETSMKFKVGDKVKVSNSWDGHDGKIGQIVDIDVYNEFPHEVRFEGMGAECFREGDLELVEEEKVMKFKVGDKVKVKDSWFGHDGQVGVVFRTDNYGPFNYSVKFDVEGDDGMRRENFKGDSLELAKQQFTKSDLKTGMGVVLRNGRKGHVLADTGCVDVIRFLENGNYSCLNDFSDDLTSNYKEEHDIVEVYFTEYQFKLLTDQVFDQDCVFKREEPTKMTMKEINEHFGKPIEIVE